MGFDPSDMPDVMAFEAGQDPECVECGQSHGPGECVYQERFEEPPTNRVLTVKEAKAMFEAIDEARTQREWREANRRSE